MLYISKNAYDDKYEVYGGKYGEEQKILKYIKNYLNEKKAPFYEDIIITICDEGYYWTIMINGKKTMALSKTEPGVYSNNYCNYISFKEYGYSKKEFIEILFEAVRLASDNIKEILLKDIDSRLEKLGFEIGLKAKNQDNTYYIYCEGYKVGTYNAKNKSITCFGYTDKDSYKLLSAKRELLDFVLCEKETPNDV